MRKPSPAAMIANPVRDAAGKRPETVKIFSISTVSFPDRPCTNGTGNARQKRHSTIWTDTARAAAGPETTAAGCHTPVRTI